MALKCNERGPDGQNRAMRRNLAKFIAPVMIASAVSALAACQFADTDQVLVKSPKRDRGSNAEKSIFGEGGIEFFGPGGDDQGGGAAGIGVNSLLWRASIDTISSCRYPRPIPSAA